MKNNLLKNERVNWVDWTKTIGITLVIMGHLNFENAFINQFIYSFHMPLFFVISGYLFKPTGNYWCKNFKLLIIPYLVYCVINYVWWFVFSLLRHPEIYKFSFETGVLKPLVGILIGIDYITKFSYPIPGPLWFLIAMFWVRIAANYFLNRTQKTSVLIYVSGLCVFVVFLLYRWNVDLWFSIDSAMLAFPFFVLGLYLKKYFRGFKKKIVLVLTFSCILFTYWLSIWNGHVDMNLSNFGRNIFVYYINGVTGSFIVFGCSFLINAWKSRFVTEISIGTIMIIGLHTIVTNGILNFLIEQALGVNSIEYSCLGGLLLSCFSLLIFYYPILLSHSYLPFLIGKR